ncbi:MAG: hypothetical protein ACFFG0_14165 [Candidatus Thorarchaeota archaeon]
MKLLNIYSKSSISNFKGYYASEAALNAAYAAATNGDFAIVGATDTVWCWDSDTSAWVDSGSGGIVTSVFGRIGDVVAQNNDYTWAQIDKTTSSLSDIATMQLGSNLDLNEKSISYNLPDADGEYTGMISTQTVDTNAVGVGAVLCFTSGDGNFDEADADAATTMGELVLACETGTGSKIVLHRGWMYKSNWGFSPSKGVAYVSLTQGTLTQDVSGYTTNDVVQKVGYFYTTSGTAGLLRFKPSIDYIEII